MAQAIGTTSSVNECDCCGKKELKLTVIIRLDDGQVVNYGTTCAKRNTGKVQREINEEVANYAAQMLAHAQARFKATPEAAAERVAFDTRPRHLTGRDAMQWVDAACNAADVVRKQITAQQGIPDRWPALYR